MVSQMAVIIGAGLAGLSAAYHLKDECRILEKDKVVGGLCKSVKTNEYIFDCAPHILYTKNDYVKKLFQELLKDNLIKHVRKAYVYINNTFVEYPFEVNLNVLPREIIVECINGILNRNNNNEPKNFEEWIYTTFGDGIAKYYLIPYNQKIWKFDLSKINVDFISKRVPSPGIQEIKQGATKKLDKKYGANAIFYYPKYDGIGALANKLASNVSNISLNSKVIEIKSINKKLYIKYIKNNEIEEVNTDTIISSLPLPDIIEIIDDIPEEVHKAAKSLNYNSLICINLGIKRPNLTDKHWLYFPEKEFIFNRVSFPMNFSKFTTPDGRSSILVEVTQKGNYINVNEIKEKVIEGLLDANIIKDNDEVEVCDANHFKYAYIIYDFEHKKNVSIIHEYLKSKNIIPIGRFGEWEYFNIDKSILSGKRAAVKLNEVKL